MSNYARPLFNRGRVDWAGDVLRDDSVDPEWTEERHRIFLEALPILDNWRAIHARPLQHLKMTLKDRALRVDGEALVAQRLKRMSSISYKLARNSHMKLSQMQDIGGCRAVLKNIIRVRQLVALFEAAVSNKPKEGPEFVRKSDYIENPKADGYRSVHLIYKFRSSAPSVSEYNGLRIEIQLRSHLQHAWATAVETADTFTGQALKSNVGSDDWRRFFVLMGSVMAFREHCPVIPGTPSNKKELGKELRDLSAKLNVEVVLSGWSRVVEGTTGPLQNARMFLMTLDPTPSSPRIQVQSFQSAEWDEAQAAYLEAERQVTGSNKQAVLVWADSLAALKRAYPNYFLDTERFLYRLRQAVKGYR